MTTSKHIFDLLPIKIDDSYIERCAKYYIKLLTNEPNFDEKIESDTRFADIEFSSSFIKDLLKKCSIPTRVADKKVGDIYRSDLGELLLIAYFEKVLKIRHPNQENFTIPVKNISIRETADQPSRGYDLVGYRQDNKLTLLLGEAKVSDEQKSPPSVVHSNSDSIYKQHLLSKKDSQLLLKKINQIRKKTSYKHAKALITIMCLIEDKKLDQFEIVYGCCLVRDESCRGKNDFGKMKTQSSDFDPNKVHFVLVSYDKKIEEVVNRFHAKVLELANKNE